MKNLTEKKLIVVGLDKIQMENVKGGFLGDFHPEDPAVIICKKCGAHLKTSVHFCDLGRDPLLPQF